LIGVSLRPGDWNESIEDPEVADSFAPIVAIAAPDEFGVDPFKNPKEYEEMLDRVPACAVEIFQWWGKKLGLSTQADSIQANSGTVHRSTPKISPNDPCPCGSGKKYKRCCSPVSSVRKP
jgi:uncharacterized protein YecA (UPF0149 family)